MPQPGSRRLSFALALGLMLGPLAPARADQVTGRDWQLLAIDGAVVAPGATLRFEVDGRVLGKAPCNLWSTQSTARLPDLSLRPIRATRMACPRLDEERSFFDALSRMTAAGLAGTGNLVLTGPGGRSLEFAPDRSGVETLCTTCPPTD